MRKVRYRFGVCLSACLFAIAANAQSPDPLVLDMTGTPVVGQDVTIAFKDGQVPVGKFFDIWICSEEAQAADRRPYDQGSNEENAGCSSLIFWVRRDFRGITFQLTDEYDSQEEAFVKVDVRDPQTDEVIQEAGPDGGIRGGDFCARRGPLLDRLDSQIEPPFYLITNDYDGGGHSNWFGPFQCNQVTSIPTNSNWGLFVLMAMLLTFGVLVVRGRMA